MTIKIIPVEYYCWKNADNLTWKSSITWENPVKRCAIYGSFQENASVVITAHKGVREAFESTVSMAEEKSKWMEKKSCESLDFAVTYFDCIDFLLKFVESVHTDDVRQSITRRDFGDSINLRDRLTREYLYMGQDNLKITDYFKRDIAFFRLLLSVINMKTQMAGKECKQLGSVIVLKDKAVKGENKANYEEIPVNVSDSRAVDFIRKYDELAILMQKMLKGCGHNADESINAVDSMLHKAKSVISDICFSAEEINTDSPPGYGAFKVFLPGDYRYQKAIFKTLIETSLTGKKALLDEFLIKVDLPDIQDMGTESIPAQATTVKFSKAFFRIPEVTITMRAGEGIVPVPVIRDITREYFIVELKDSAGNLTSGRISWTALGC